jgi:hypothetical protein
MRLDRHNLRRQQLGRFLHRRDEPRLDAPAAPVAIGCVEKAGPGAGATGGGSAGVGARNFGRSGFSAIDFKQLPLINSAGSSAATSSCISSAASCSAALRHLGNRSSSTVLARASGNLDRLFNNRKRALQFQLVSTAACGSF